ncbi:uncharacterized protein LOC118436422 [Folsomia candida]|nr:uncharacterized protein LOC118436422 [Folsomia candida]
MISHLVQNQVSLHNFHPKTIWFYNGYTFHPNVRRATGGFPLDENHLEDMLPNLERPENVFLPLIIGDFGKDVRKIHTDLYSFIFLAILKTPLELEEFIKINGNRRRDRFIFVGKEPSLSNLFHSEVIKGLKDKVGLTIPKHGMTTELLLDPVIYNPSGEMVKVSIHDVQDFSNIIKVGPLMGRNLRGRHLKITGSLLPTWLYRISDDKSPQGLQHDGSNYRIFVEASRRFNFTFDLDAPPGKVYAAKLANGTWVGQTGDLFYTERGYTNSIYLGQIYGLLDFVEYASTIDHAHLMFFAGRAKMESNSESFLLPYQREVWISVIVVYVAIILTVFCLLVPKPWKKNDLTWRDAAYHAICVPYLVALEQALSKVPISVRFIVGLWLVMTIVTGTGYRCNLASFLSVPTIPPVPRTFAELAADPDYCIILNNVGVPEVKFFQLNDNPTIKAVTRRLIYNPDSDDCAKQAFLHKKTICVGWRKIILTASLGTMTINTRLDPLIPSNDIAMLVPMSVAFVKDSILVDSMTPITGFIFSTGLHNKWTDEAYFHFKILGKAKVEKSDKGSELYLALKEFEDSITSLGALKPFNLENVIIPFYSLIFGLLISGIGFLLEIGYAHCSSRFFDQTKKVRRRIVSPMNTDKENKTNLVVLGQLGHLQICVSSQ